MLSAARFTVVAVFLNTIWAPGSALAQDSDAGRLVSALLGETPLVSDLKELTDTIGGRPTGSKANLAAVDWALAKFDDADVAAQKEAFTLPRFWQERETRAYVSGDGEFTPRVVAKTYAPTTPDGGLTAPLVNLGFGTAADFEALGEQAAGKWLIVQTRVLEDISGLFREYGEAAEIDARAIDSGAAGLIYMSSRPKKLLYRHNAAAGPANELPMMVVAREDAQRIMRLLDSGAELSLTAHIDVDDRGAFESHNVIAEIPGSDLADEIIIFGAHLDSFGMGTGGNDNGANVAMMIDLARQMTRLGIQPRRTIRIALWNGEEMGLFGSRRYVEQHADEIERFKVAGSIDIGSGRILGFFTNGRPAIADNLDRALEPVSGLGPFTHADATIAGTDHFDFLLQGVASLVGNHDPYNYGPNYHAESDTFDKVDTRQLRLNAAIVGATLLGLANDPDLDVPRLSRAEIEDLVESTALKAQMEMFGLYQDWVDGRRGRRD